MRCKSRKLLLMLPIVLVGMSFNACATRRELAGFRYDTAYIREQLDSLRIEQQRLHALMMNYHTAMERTTATAAQNEAELRVSLAYMAGQLEALNERLEDTNRRVSNLPAKLRLVTPAAAVPADTAKPATLVDSAKAELRHQFPGSVRLYDLSYQDLVKGNYVLAREGFVQYLRLLPAGELADDSQYWIGESYYAEQRYQDAASAYGSLLDNYPQSDRAPAAMLKLGLALLELGQETSGRAGLDLLVRRFPRSNEAGVARERLSSIKDPFFSRK